jgi:hypothetical protein
MSEFLDKMGQLLDLPQPQPWRGGPADRFANRLLPGLNFVIHSANLNRPAHHGKIIF